MSTYSMDPEEATQNTVSPRKNHWAVKLCPHIIILACLIDLLVGNYLILNIFIVLLWLWFGNSVQKDIVIVNKHLYPSLIFLVGVNLFTVYLDLPKILELWTRLTALL